VTDIQKLALAFRWGLERELSCDQFAEMRRRNVLPEHQVNSCASHDFCDANLVMYDAFEAVFGREALVQENEDDLDLWNAAWNFAKDKYFTSWEHFQG
jgi:hypothetical protein